MEVFATTAETPCDIPPRFKYPCHAPRPGTTKTCCARSCSASSGSSSTRPASPPRSRSRRGRRGARRSACASATTSRSCSAPTAPSRRQSDEGPRDHAGGRMAARQLPPGRGADPRDPRGPAAGLLPAAAEARERAVRRVSACVRHRLGLRRAYRQPLRAGDAAPLRARLPARAAADHRRAVGHRDHAAHRAGREPAARRAAHRAAAARLAQDADDIADRLLGVNGHAAEPDALSAATPTAPTFPRLRGRSSCSGCATRTRGHAGAGVAGASGSRRRARRRGDRARRAPAAGRSNITVRNIITSMRLISDLDWPDFFESVSLVDEVLRAGSDFAEHGLCDPQSLPQRDRGTGPGLDAHRARHCRRGHWQPPRTRRGRGPRARPGLPPDRPGRRSFERVGYRASRAPAGRWSRL